MGALRQEGNLYRRRRSAPDDTFCVGKAPVQGFSSLDGSEQPGRPSQMRTYGIPALSLPFAAGPLRRTSGHFPVERRRGIGSADGGDGRLAEWEIPVGDEVEVTLACLRALGDPKLREQNTCSANGDTQFAGTDQRSNIELETSIIPLHTLEIAHILL